MWLRPKLFLWENRAILIFIVLFFIELDVFLLFLSFIISHAQEGTTFKFLLHKRKYPDEVLPTNPNRSSSYGLRTKSDKLRGGEIVTGGTEPCFISTAIGKFRKSKILHDVFVVFVRWKYHWLTVFLKRSSTAWMMRSEAAITAPFIIK